MLPNILSQRDEADGKVVSVSLKAGADAGKIAFKLKVAFEVSSIDEAKVLEKVHPGAIARFIDSTDEKSTRKRRAVEFFNEPLTIDIADKARAVAVVKNQAASLRSIQLIANVKRCVAIFEFTFVGEAPIAASLASLLSTPEIFVCTERLQNVLPFGVKKAMVPEIEDIVFCQVEVAGVLQDRVGKVLEIDVEHEIIVFQDFTAEMEATFGQIRSKVTLDTDHDDYADLVADYAERCARREVEASWAPIISSIAQSGIGDDVVVLTPSIIDRAMTIIEENAKGMALAN